MRKNTVKPLTQKATKGMTTTILTTTKALLGPLKGLFSVYANPKLLFVGGIYAAIKAYLLRDQLISPQLTFGLLELVLIDTVLGVWKHFKAKTISSSGFGSFVTKIIIYWLFVRAADQLAHIKVSEFASLDWTGDLLISGLLIRESISILENMEAIRPGIIPNWITKRLKDFEDDGKLNDSDSNKPDA